MTDGLAWIMLTGSLLLLVGLAFIAFEYGDSLFYNADNDQRKIERCLSRHGAANLGYHDHYLGCTIWPRS